jgi:hypothetical protein
MKKLALFTMLLSLFVSCKQTPQVNYECPEYFTKKDWKTTTNKNGDSILLYSLDHNISLKKQFPSSTDSTKFTTLLYSEQFNKLPPQNELYLMVYESLLKSHSACKHGGTFKPYEVNLMFMDGDSTLSIKVDFFASNSYGTPGELHGTYKFDTKTYNLKDDYVTEY